VQEIGKTKYYKLQYLAR